MVEELRNGLMLHFFHYLFLFICFPMFCLIATFISLFISVYLFSYVLFNSHRVAM